MKLMVILLVILLAGATAVSAKIKTWQEDLNRDGIKETITRDEYIGGNNLWCDFTVAQGKKVLFRKSRMCLSNKEGCFLLKKKNQTAIVYYMHLNDMPRYTPDYFIFRIYHWKNGKYGLSDVVYSSKRYSDGEKASQEVGKGVAKRLKFYMVLAGYFKTKKEAEKWLEKAYLVNMEVPGHYIDQSSHYLGLKPGCWVVFAEYSQKKKKDADNWCRYTNEHIKVAKYQVILVTKLCDDEREFGQLHIFDSRQY